MKAPSEKHLQDYIWQHFQVEPDYPDHWALPWYRLIGKEVILPSGYADFVGLDCPCFFGLPRNAIMVVETKKDAINHHALNQILRYIRDIQKIWKYAIAGMPDVTSFGDHLADSPVVAGTLIGSSVSDEILIAAEAAHICVMTYDFDGIGYALEYADQPSLPESEYLSFHESDIADAIRGVYQDEVDTMQRRNPERKLCEQPSIDTYWQFYEQRQKRDSKS